MAKNKKIEIDGQEITIISQKDDDYISLTDMAKSQMQEVIIIKWLKLLSILASGKRYIIQILIIPNSVQLKMLQAAAAQLIQIKKST